MRWELVDVATAILEDDVGRVKRKLLVRIDGDHDAADVRL